MSGNGNPVFAAVLAVLWTSSLLGEEPKVREHWAFRPLAKPTAGASIDQLVNARLASNKMSLSAPAPRWAQLRRLYFDLTGHPPTVRELKSFLSDTSVVAWEKQVERLLTSPAYGERWGKHWLDVAGYADSNGYFSADTDRPYAFKYRDYVIRSFLQGKPFDQFIREQLAGDEIAANRNRLRSLSASQMRDLFTATHFLRNAPDGSSESDGNPEEVIVDRATALNGSLQITMNALLGITIQCARCHEHKFEPIEQAEYYQLQSIFYPAFPVFHTDRWVTPKQRVYEIASQKEKLSLKSENKRIDKQIRELRESFATWIRKSRPSHTVLFEDRFERKSLTKEWSNTISGDDSPAGTPVIQLDSTKAPSAHLESGELHILESGAAGDRWLVTTKSFDWTPDKKGQSIQVTFDLIHDRKPGEPSPSQRIAFCIALHDFDDSSKVAGGNLLIDGNPAGKAALHLDYPGDDAKSIGSIGEAKYESGRNYGIRVTNIGDGKFQLEHLVDWVAEPNVATLTEAELPNGAFGFEYCCGRSFVVDNVVIETSDSNEAQSKEWLAQLRSRRAQRDKGIQDANRQRPQPIGQIAPVTEVMSPTPKVYVRVRGEYGLQGQEVQPSVLEALSHDHTRLETKRLDLPSVGTPSKTSSGRRLAFAEWLTEEGTAASGLLARVIANRIWQHHFGTGLVRTPDNFGESGSAPTHPKVLEFLAAELVRADWDLKHLHRLIVQSAVYRQSSAAHPDSLKLDPDNQLLSRYPLRRLDAEAVRDAMLFVSTDRDTQMYGPYTPTVRSENGVVVNEDGSGARRRSVYLQQRRTQVNTFLELFDAPSIVSNCSQRTPSTVPLQSLAQLNSKFAQLRAQATARILLKQTDDPLERLQLAFQTITGRRASQDEFDATKQFMNEQRRIYKREDQVWADICQMLFASNAFLYLE